MHLSKNSLALIIACIFLLIPLYLLKTQATLAMTGVEVEATVIEFNQKMRKGHSTFYPVIEFDLEGGGTQTTQLHSASNPPAYQIGESISIIYSEEDPKEVVVNDTFMIYGFPIIMIVLVLGFILIMLPRVRKEWAENR